MTIKNLYPTQRPALDLNFANSKRLDPRVSLTRASTATYVGSDGLIKTAAAGEARFDHDPVTGESLGLLVEASGVNQWKYSDRWGQPDPETPPTNISDGKLYTTNGVIYNAGIAPDGTNTAIQVGSTSTASMYGVTEPATICTFSTFVKQLTSTTVTISSHTSLSFNVTFNFTTETFTIGYFPSYVTGSAGFKKYPNGWYRIWFSYDRSLQSNGNLWPKVVGSATNNALLWGVQKEAGSFPTSYIPTDGTPGGITRAADVASLTNTNVYDTDSFTILNNPYGAAGGGSTLNIVGGGQTPVKRTTVYNQELSQSQINTLVKKDDEFWQWRILGSSFALPSFVTDGQVTVDWGDGTVETLTTSEHTFTDGGGYHDVGFRLDSGTYFRVWINNNGTHKDKVIALGPAPESMKLHGQRGFKGCSNLKAVDATIDANGSNSLYEAWYGCSNLTSFPLIDTSSVTDFQSAWHSCSSLTSFPLIDTSSGTNFSSAWYNCSSLTSFPLIDTSSGTSFTQAWYNCSNLTGFPLINTSGVTSFYRGWAGCSSLTSFPLIDTSSGTNFYQAWNGCSSLTSFPLIDTSSGTSFNTAWNGCSSLTTFPAGFFDSWTGTPENNCFVNAWNNCTSLTATSVENILNSIDTSGQSAPASGVDITIDYDAGTGTPSVSTAVTNLKSRGWTITLNGVAQ